MRARTQVRSSWQPWLAAFLASSAIGLFGCQQSGHTSTAPVSAPQPVADLEYAEADVEEIGVHGGGLTFPRLSGPRTFNPTVQAGTSTRDVTYLMFDGLVEMDHATHAIRPALAHRWEVDDDGRTWTFHLRPGVRFSDGAPVRAEDVLFTFDDVLFHPDYPNPAADRIRVGGELPQVSAIDPTTVQLRLPEPFAPLLEVLTDVSFSILPRHLLSGAAPPSEFGTLWTLDTAPDALAGTGPFRLASYAPDRVLLERNPFYWKADPHGSPLPYLDRLVYSIAPDMDTWRLKFLSHDVDAYGRLLLDDVETIREEAVDRGFRLHDAGPYFNFYFIAFNQNPGRNAEGRPYVDPTRRAWFEDVEFRRAVAHAIDQQAIVDTVFSGHGVPIAGPLTPANTRYHHPELAPREYSPELAGQLLDAAGYLDRDGDGRREGPDGSVLSFRLVTNAGHPERAAMARFVAEDLRAVGIEVDLQIEAFNSLITRLQGTYDWDVMLMGLAAGVDPHDGVNVFHSSAQLHLWNPAQETPATEWEERIDALFEEARRTLDVDRRVALYREFQEVLYAEVPMIFLPGLRCFYASHPHVGNFRPNVLTPEATWNAWALFRRPD